MTDEELIGRMRSTGCVWSVTEAADRIEALIQERDTFQAAAQQQMARAEALEDYVERNDYIGGWRARAEGAEAEVERMRGLLSDLISWFPDKPSRPEWRITAGEHGADDAVAAARAALATEGTPIEKCPTCDGHGQTWTGEDVRVCPECKGNTVVPAETTP